MAKDKKKKAEVEPTEAEEGFYEDRLKALEVAVKHLQERVGELRVNSNASNHVSLVGRVQKIEAHLRDSTDKF